MNALIFGLIFQRCRRRCHRHHNRHRHFKFNILSNQHSSNSQDSTISFILRIFAKASKISGVNYYRLKSYSANPKTYYFYSFLYYSFMCLERILEGEWVIQRARKVSDGCRRLCWIVFRVIADFIWNLIGHCQHHPQTPANAITIPYNLYFSIVLWLYAAVRLFVNYNP